MPIELKMPALSPTMEEGTLAKWLVKEGDTVKSGDILAEIETDKATMEFEAVDEGTIAKIVVADGTDGVKVGAVIAIMAGEGEDASAASAAPAKAEAPAPKAEAPKAEAAPPRLQRRRLHLHRPQHRAAPAPKSDGDRVKASPLARRLAEAQGIDLSALRGSGPGGRIVKADVDGAAGKPLRRRLRRLLRRPRPPAGAAPGPGRDRHSARGDQALQHAQDDRPPPDRGQADDPAHLSHRRYPARRPAQAARRSQQEPGEPRASSSASTTC